MCGNLALLPFSLYIITHELIHIVRFSRFLQNFDASDEEKMMEERRVHQTTHEILLPIRLSGVARGARIFLPVANTLGEPERSVILDIHKP